MKITEKNLEKLGFDKEGTELGDDGAMELEIGEYTLLWIPKIGRYTAEEVVGWWLEKEKMNFQLPLTTIKSIEKLKILIKFLK